MCQPHGGVGEHRNLRGRRAAGVRHCPINPGVALATADVFRGRSGACASARAELPAAWRDARDMADDLGRQRNDVQPAAIALRPVIGEVLSALEAARMLTRMSGSGATCWPRRWAAAGRGASRLQRPGWWC